MPRSSRGMTAENVAKRSRDTLRPSLASIMTLSTGEGAGNTGCWPHPRALRAEKCALCARKKPQGSRNNRRSLRNSFTAYTWSPRSTGLVSLRRLALVTRGLIPASGNRDRTISPYAIRASSLRASRPSHPAAHVRDDREAPLRRRRDGRIQSQFSEKRKQLFSREGLKRLID